MGLYRIAIQKAETNDEGRVITWKPRCVIDASTEYKLDEAIQEWITTEIDPGAEIAVHKYPHNPANTTCPGEGIKCLCWDIDNS